jgi:DHA2 family multidrug resistance protein
LLIAPLAGLLLRRVDGRLVMSAGFIMVGCACWMAANGLTRDWATDDFLPSQVLQAVGQSLAVSGIIFFAIINLRLQDAMTFGAMLQIARLFGGEVGTGFMQSWVRVREQVASYLFGLHLQAGDPAVLARIDAYAAAVSANSAGPAEAASRGTALLAAAVKAQANVQSYIDGFGVEAFGVVLILGIVVLLRPAPLGPASPSGLFARLSRSG